MSRNDLRVAAFLATKNLLKSRTTSLVIIAVMAMSFLSITFFAAIIDGLGYEFEEGMIRGVTGHLMIEPKEEERFITESEQLVRNIRRIPGVVGVTGRVGTNAVVSHEGTELGVPVLFIDPDAERHVSGFADAMQEGTYLSSLDERELLIGASLVASYAEPDDTQQRLQVMTGERLTLSFSNGRVEEFRIKGIYQTGSKFVDDKVLINNDVYATYFGNEDVADQILITLPRRGVEEEYTRAIRAIGVPEPINPWQTKMGAVNQFVGSLQITNQITGFIGLLTAFATVYIIIFINVTNKRKQIGILKAIGIKKSIILNSYIFQSVTYGVVGVIAGNVAMVVLLSWLASHPLTMPIGEVTPLLTTERRIATSVTLVITSIVAGFFPSKKAADDNILEAIFGG